MPKLQLENHLEYMYTKKNAAGTISKNKQTRCFRIILSLAEKTNNCIYIPTHLGSDRSSGMLERLIRGSFLTRVMSKRALRSGSSKQGNAFRASVGENCVAATYLKFFKTKCPASKDLLLWLFIGSNQY